MKKLFILFIISLLCMTGEVQAQIRGKNITPAITKTRNMVTPTKILLVR